jgi:hypothetical protein
MVKRQISMRNPRLFVVILTALTACAEPPKLDKPRSQMSQRERDSTIAASGLPGAGVVKKGLSIADAEDKRQAMFDSIGNP